MDIFQKLANLFLPRICLDCGQKVSHKDSFRMICENCADSVLPVWNETNTRCGICQTPLLSDSVKICYDCTTNPPSFESAHSVFFYHQPVVRALIHAFKFNSDLNAGRDLAQLIRPFISTILPSVDLILPIPLSAQSLKKRGFNQVSWVLKELNINFREGVLLRQDHKKAQRDLSREQRMISIVSQFSLSPQKIDIIRDQNILIVDDIYTTGSTARTVSNLLLQNGAKKVFVLTFCRD